MDVDTLNTLSLISLERLIHWSMITNQPVLQVERTHVKLDILLPVSEIASNYYRFHKPGLCIAAQSITGAICSRTGIRLC